jgi:hypothetical protein
MATLPTSIRTKIDAHYISCGYHASATGNNTLGINMGTLSKKYATKIEPKEKSPDSVAQHQLSFSIILARNIKPEGKISPPNALCIILNLPPLIH